MVDLGGVRQAEQRDIDVAARDREALLVRWLTELLYYLDAEEMLFSRFEMDEMTDMRCGARLRRTDRPAASRAALRRQGGDPPHAGGRAGGRRLPGPGLVRHLRTKMAASWKKILQKIDDGAGCCPRSTRQGCACRASSSPPRRCSADRPGPGAGAGGERGLPAGHRRLLDGDAGHPLGLRLPHRRRGGDAGRGRRRLARRRRLRHQLRDARAPHEPDGGGDAAAPEGAGGPALPRHALRARRARPGARLRSRRSTR